MLSSPTDRQSGTIIGRVVEVWRYPVKSIGGERLPRAVCDRRGVVGDRTWAVIGEDGKIGSGKTTRRFRRMPGLLTLTSHTDENGQVWVVFPDGERRRVDDPETARRVGDIAGEEVHLERETEVSHFDASPLHAVSTTDLSALQASLPAVDLEQRRFRPNLVVDVSEELVPGCHYLVGESVGLSVERPTVRCVMTTMTQPNLAFAPGVLKHLERTRDTCFGVYVDIEQPGDIAVGDPVSIRTARMTHWPSEGKRCSDGEPVM